MCADMLNLHIGLMLASSLDAGPRDIVCAPRVFMSGFGVLFDPLIAEKAKQDTFRASYGEEAPIFYAANTSRFMAREKEYRLGGRQHMPQTHSLYFGSHLRHRPFLHRPHCAARGLVLIEPKPDKEGGTERVANLLEKPVLLETVVVAVHPRFAENRLPIAAMNCGKLFEGFNLLCARKSAIKLHFLFSFGAIASDVSKVVDSRTEVKGKMRKSCG